MSRLLRRSSPYAKVVRSDAHPDVLDVKHGGALMRLHRDGPWATRGRATGMRLVGALGIAALVALGACGEPNDDLQMNVDMGEPLDDGGLKALEPLRVGTACGGASECGAGGECLHVSSTSTTYPGGYCTASCERSTDCGAGAECPVNEAVAIDPTFKPFTWWPRNCFQSCTPGPSAGCRTGYECRSLAKSYGVEAKAPEPMKRTVCLPVPTWRPSPGAL